MVKTFLGCFKLESGGELYLFEFFSKHSLYQFTRLAYLIGWVNFIASFSMFLFATKHFLLWSPIDCNSFNLYFYELDCNGAGILRESEFKVFLFGICCFIFVGFSFKLIKGVENVMQNSYFSYREFLTFGRFF